MVVVRQEDQIQHGNVAQQFFQSTFGRLSAENTAERVFYAFLAISSFGNIVVMTYTAARIKQEIAKEGLLPWPKFFAQNHDFSLGRLLRWAQGKRSLSIFHNLLKKRWLSPEQHSEKTPVGALILHFASCLVLIFATYGLTPDNAYNLLTGLAAYVLNAFFGMLLGAGILILRFTPSHDWRNRSKPVNHTLSILAAIVYLVGNLFPLITTWVPLSGSYKDLVSGKKSQQNPVQTTPKQVISWFVLPVVSWCVLGLGALWYLGFLGIAKRKASRAGLTFTVKKVPYFERDPPRTGPPFQDHETVYVAWVGEGDFVGADLPLRDFPARGGHDKSGAIGHTNSHPDFA
jgi:amino acid transporter